jgi:hypothetical protein
MSEVVISLVIFRFMRFERLPFSPQFIQARWMLNKLPSENVPRLAQDALESGYDGKNVRRIACDFSWLSIRGFPARQL